MDKITDTIKSQPALGVAVALGAAAAGCVAVKLWQRRSGGSVKGGKAAVPYTERQGIAAVHGLLLEPAPLESAMLSVSMTYNGGLRVSYAVTLDGAPSQAAVQGAVKSIQAAHIMLRCKAVPRTDDPSPSTAPDNLLLQMDDSLVIPVVFHAVSADKDLDRAWRDVWAVVEQLPLKFNEPLGRVDVLTQTGSGSGDSASTKAVILLSIEHSACDGFSIQALMDELLSAIAKRTQVVDTMSASSALACAASSTADASVWPAAYEPSCAANLLWWRRALLSVRHLLGLKGHYIPPFPRDDFKPPNVTPCPKSPATLVAFGELTVAESAALLARCRATGTTISGAVIAALQYATAEALVAGGAWSKSTANVSIGCCADTRRYYRQPLPSCILACHSSVVQPLTRIIPTTDLPAKAASVQSAAVECRKALEHDVQLQLPFVFSQRGHVPPVSNLTLTNWGVSPVAREYFAANNVEAFTVVSAAPVIHGPIPIVIACTSLGRLSITVLAPETQLSQATQTAICNSTVAHLVAFATSQ